MPDIVSTPPPPNIISGRGPNRLYYSKLLTEFLVQLALLISGLYLLSIFVNTNPPAPPPPHLTTLLPFINPFTCQLSTTATL